MIKAFTAFFLIVFAIALIGAVVALTASRHKQTSARAGGFHGRHTILREP